MAERLNVVSVSSGKDSQATKVCVACKRDLPLSDFWRRKLARDGLQHACKKCNLAAQEKYRTAHREAGEPTYSQRNYRRLRLEVMSHYMPPGSVKPSCACCGESIFEFLSLDHINGGGMKHRKEIAKVGSVFYRWIKNHGFPPGYRILCHNCNQAIGNWGYCPHSRGGKHIDLIRESEEPTACSSAYGLCE